MHGQALPKEKVGQLASRGSYCVCDGSLSRPRRHGRGSLFSQNLEPECSARAGTYLPSSAAQLHTYFTHPSIDRSPNVAHSAKYPPPLDENYIIHQQELFCNKSLHTRYNTSSYDTLVVDAASDLFSFAHLATYRCGRVWCPQHSLWAIRRRHVAL